MTPSTSAARVDNAERQPIPLPSGPDSPACPKCSGRMWDNRASKRNPKAPDFKCRNSSCDGVLWPGKHRTAFVVTEPPRLAAVSDSADTEKENNDGATAMLPVLRRKYLDLTDFVLDSVRPKYEQHGLECRPDTVAAIAATLYIAETRRDGL
ncbi:MAG: hypothetical protein ACREPM_15595 [Gemmatimonadaceae bacterium]